MNDIIETPWSSVGQIVYARTYSQYGGQERWPDTVDRIIRAAQSQLYMNLTEHEQNRLRYFMLTLKGMPAGRVLWQLGMPKVKSGFTSLQNCAIVEASEPSCFSYLMKLLGLGCGVTVTVYDEEAMQSLREVSPFFIGCRHEASDDADYIVPDSLEGWCGLVDRLFKAVYAETKEDGFFTYSCKLVRQAGLPIKGFGGVSCGPEPLIIGIQQICDIINQSGIIDAVTIGDICCSIAQIIIAGNVRRSAIMLIGNPSDKKFVKMKQSSDFPIYRSFANLSVVVNHFDEITEDIWDTYKAGYECIGFINLDTARQFGRLGEIVYDIDIIGTNPCGEQFLNNYETCCLSELNIPLLESLEEAKELAVLLYKINKHILCLEGPTSRTTSVVHKNMRMGISVSGIMQSLDKLDWLPEIYSTLRRKDDIYSKYLGVNPSIKLTTIKPSGTLSLLPGITPGIHPGFGKYMLRRIRLEDKRLLTMLEEKGVHIEPCEYNKNTFVATFPFKYTSEAITESSITALDQLEMIKIIQGLWSDNSISCTVYYRNHELPEIREYLSREYKNFKSLSFMLKSEMHFKQMPFEEVTKDIYENYSSKIKDFDFCNIGTGIVTDECDNGSCAVR